MDGLFDKPILNYQAKKRSGKKYVTMWYKNCWIRREGSGKAVKKLVKRRRHAMMPEHSTGGEMFAIRLIEQQDAVCLSL
jgi:hypothetical protein